MTLIDTSESIHTNIKAFNDALIFAAEKHVGTVKPGKRTKSWYTPTVRGAIRKRNRLRREINTKRKQWVEACQEAQKSIRSAKEDAWKDVLEDTINSPDEGKMWRLIKNLNGSPDTNSPNEAMSYNGRLITSSSRKADIFTNHYAEVSKLHLSAEERATNRSLKKRLRSHRSDPTEEQPDFTMCEMKQAIQKMKTKGAPGPDRIPPSFLKNLGPVAQEKLLLLFNRSFRLAECPQIWRNAIIVPLLKAGKSASELASFRPISLTSCVVKLLERMFAERLYDMAETKGMLSDLQAGFRKGRGCEDQILRLVQKIDDGFQKKHKSLLVLLDFSKAYDTVWRERLLTTMLDRGIPSQYVQWLFAFLQNRQANVRFNGTLSKTKKMCQGLPQGSVLAPILFLFYINELAAFLPDDVLISMYADDVSILATSKTLEDAEQLAQKAVDAVVTWSTKWKLNLNGTKSEAAFFSRSTTDSIWTPTIKIAGRTIKHELFPRLLGVTLDKQLIFNKHVEIITDKATGKMRMLGAISHSSWGWRKQDLRKVYLAHIQSILTFASSSWQPALSDSTMHKLEVKQNQALRMITGQARSSPTEAIRNEAGVRSIQATANANCLCSMEKALRLPTNHPAILQLPRPPNRG